MSDRLVAAFQKASGALRAELNPQGHWRGELSRSALSTATAVIALHTAGQPELVPGGLRWLAEHRNADGGWGDTVLSKSNISTTALCWAAFGAVGADAEFPEVVAGAEEWLRAACGVRGPGVPVEALVPAIEGRYGKDRTFSVPILMTCALARRLGPDGWRHVKPLPFELAAFPPRFYAALQLPVVSYALPALIAIGQTIHHHGPRRNLVSHTVRQLARRHTLRLLERIQPPNGGFLEATPLTSFVTMSLASMGLRDHTVTRRGVSFLQASVRPDGSWPIDTDLATWVSMLAIKAIGPELSLDERTTLREWLLGQQHRVIHPYTQAAPGAWAWTELPGGVPDADDTPGALLALLVLGPMNEETAQAGAAGVEWLLGVQNRDGGIPTFCRGWGALPFDRSSPDLTAHTLRAWSAWRPHLAPALAGRVERAITRALSFLARTVSKEGSWLPLWFGNEHVPGDENPVYGTAQVLIALRELRHRGHDLPATLEHRAALWLVKQQNAEGGWGGQAGAPSSTEETGLALEALLGTEHVPATDRGLAWLIDRVESGAWRQPAPIGFYFAKLWYYERLYPLIFAAGALRKASGYLTGGELSTISKAASP